MPAERNSFKLGLTMIVFFALFVGVIWFLAPGPAGDMIVHVRYPHQTYTTVLKPGGDVNCGGKRVGSVTGIDLKEMKNAASGYKDLYTILTIQVDSNVGLRQDAEILPTEQLIGGLGALVIRDRGQGELVKSGATIDGTAASSFSELTNLISQQLDPRNPAGLLAIVQSQLDANAAGSLLGKIHASLDDVNAITRSLTTEFDVKDKAAVLAKLHLILDNVNGATRLLRSEMDGKSDPALVARLHRTLDTMNEGLMAVRQILDENRGPVHQTILNMRDTSEILEEQIAARLAEQLDTRNAAGLLAKVHAAIAKLGASLDDVNDITRNIREVVALNRNNVDTIIRNLKETSDHLRSGSEEIRLNPWLLLYTPTQDEVSQQNLFATARAFSEAATRLDDSIARLQALSQAARPDAPPAPEEMERIRAELKDTFSKFTEAEQKLWELLKIK